MINGMDTALRHIHDNIPERILQLIFTGGLSLDEKIKEDVIYKTVLPDCNLKGGKVIPIELHSSWAKNVPNEPFSLFEIPIEAREGRNIIEVHSVSENLSRGSMGGSDYAGACPSSSVNSFRQSGAMIYATNAMLASKTLFNTGSRAPIVELQGNMVKLHPAPGRYIPWLLSCRVCYDTEMTNLNSAAIEKFADVCEAAVKRYCYNVLILGMDVGTIEFGADLPALKDIVTRWGDMKQEYNEACSAFAFGTKLDIRRFAPIARSMM